ncbi:MAG: phenylacetate--CoA ligase family protein [Planctomycetota bacterium]
MTFIPRAWRLGSEYRRLLAQISESQWWPGERLKVLQERKLNKLIRHCYEQVPFYREIMRGRGLLPEDIQTLEDLEKLPFLTKSLLKEHFEDLKARDFEQHKPRLAHSGGTSGDNLELYLSEKAYLIERASYARRFDWAGFHEGERCVYLRGPLNLTWPDGRPRLWYYNVYEKWLQMETLGLNEALLESVVQKIASFKPKVISAFPSVLEILARFLLARGIRIPSVKTIITSSETVFPWQRTLARKAFGCEVFDWYGQAEHAASAAQCPAGSYHINVEYTILELIDPDGRPITEGCGEIVGTCLDNHAQPLLRYRLGDLAERSAEQCSCGRTLPVLRSLQGRKWESFLRPDGSQIPATVLGMRINSILDTGQLGQLQIRQTRSDRVEVDVVPEPGFRRDTLDALLAELQSELGEEVEIHTRYIRDIPKTQAGKHQLFLCHPSVRDRAIPEIVT